MSRHPLSVVSLGLVFGGAFACGRPASDATQRTSEKAEPRSPSVVIEVKIDGNERWAC